FTQERLAERLGKSRPAVANAVRLLSLSDAVKARLRGGGLTVGHARALLALPEADRDALAARVEREGLTVRDVERLGERRTKEPRAQRPSQKTPDVEAVEARLRYQLSAPVAIVPTGVGGRIEIRYADGADLARLIDVLLPEGV
ncbi:MAG: ParB/RepB/Spo0J family partition protein, partial [Vulcanimicrobiaceae bacterium]